MDKYELNLKLDQMKSLCTVGDYEAAAEVADSVNWTRVRNANALVKVGEIYEKAGRLGDCKDLYLLAYEKAPIGRKIIYRLAEIALRMKDYDLAQEYYDEFIEIAPNDNLRFALQYKIRKLQGASAQELIAILEEYQKNEYVEEWAFELARLYHLAGYRDKCVAACDELILWFGKGKYVEKALELKILYQPLTKEQEKKYRNYRMGKESFMEIKTDELNRSERNSLSDLKIPVVEAPHERFNTSNLQKEIAEGIQQIMDATEEDTVIDTIDNLKRITKDIPFLNITGSSAALPIKVMDEMLDEEKNPEINNIYSEERDGQISMITEEEAQEKQITGQMTLQDILDDWEKKKKAAELALKQAEERNLENKKAIALQEAEGIMERLNDMIPKLDAGLTTREIMDEIYLGESAIESDQEDTESDTIVWNSDMKVIPEHDERDTKEIKGEALDEIQDVVTAGDEIEAAEEISEVEEIEVAEEVEEISEAEETAEAEEISEVEEIEVAEEISEVEEIKEAEEISGAEETAEAEEISEVEEIEEAEEISGAEEAAEAEEISGAEETAEAEEISEVEEIEVAEETAEAEEISEVEEIEVAEEISEVEEIEVAEETEDDIEDDIDEEDFEEEIDEEDFEDDIEDDTDEEDFEDDIEDDTDEEDFEDDIDDDIDEEDFEDDIDEEIDEEDFEDDIDDDIDEEDFDSDLDEEDFEDDIDDEEIAEENASKIVKSENNTKKRKVHPIKIIDSEDDVIEDDLDAEEAIEVGDQKVKKPAHIKRLTNEMRSAFSYFVPIKGMEPQLCQAINVISDRLVSGGKSNGGNLIIQGDPGCGKTVLAASFIKVLQDHCGYPEGKVGHIDGEALNRKNIQQLFQRVAGGCLIIEDAGKLDRNSAISMAYLMDSDETGILVILEDDEKGIDKVMGLDDNFAKKFACKVNVPIFTNDELVAFARAYAREIGYKIDDMAILALHNRISNIQRLDQATTLAEVKDIVDEAIERESYFGVYKYFSLVTGKRYTKDDRILLTERHFS